MSGPRVVLRAFRRDEVDTLWRLQRDALAAGRTWGPRSRDEVADRVVRSGAWSDTAAGLLCAIEADGRLVGDIQARRRMLPSGVVELGIDLFDEQDRGRGVGRRAVALMTAGLFDRGEAHRVQLSTDVDNTAMRTVAERLGFGFEGVMRGFMPNGDGARDHALYAITIDDYRDVKTTWT